MTSNEARASTLERALRAGLDRDRERLGQLLTDDVRAWTPSISTASFDELMTALEDRDDAFSDFELAVAPLDVGGEYAAVEWTVEMTHTGPLALDDRSIEPTGIRVTVRGVTIAEFLDDRICAVRQYWNEFAVLDQLGVTPGEE